MNSGREIVNVRFFKAPCERVFDAWTEPAALARWWGPKGFRNEFRRCEPVAGGIAGYLARNP